MARRPNRLDFVLPKTAVTDLDKLLALLGDLPRIVEASTRAAPASRISGVLDEVSGVLGIPVEDLKKIFTALENLRQMTEEMGSATDVVDAVAGSLSEASREKMLTGKAIITEAIEGYTGANPVSLSIKAQRLTYSRERVYNDVEIITDARPVFSEDGSEVIQFLITHAMMLSYFSSNRLERIQLSLDNTDVIELRKACDRAIVKSRTLQKSLGESWSTEIVNDESDI